MFAPFLSGGISNASRLLLQPLKPRHFSDEKRGFSPSTVCNPRNRCDMLGAAADRVFDRILLFLLRRNRFMKNRLLIVCLIGAVNLCLFESRLFAEGDHWLVDFEAAKAQAAKEGKSLLMEFTGSDWCPPCKALHKSVLSTDTFINETPKHFVLLKLDNPRDKSKQSEEEQQQYKRLAQEYKVSGVPTIILADDKGRPYAKKVGYGGTPAEEYVNELVGKADILKQRNALLAKAETAADADKARLLDEAISLIDEEVAISTYRDTIDQIIAADADNEAGLKSKYETLLKTADLKVKLEKIGNENRFDAKKAVAQIEQLIEESSATGPMLQEMLYAKALSLYRFDRDACKETLLEARRAAGDTQRAAEIKGILERVFKVDPDKLDAAKDDAAKEDANEDSATE